MQAKKLPLAEIAFSIGFAVLIWFALSTVATATEATDMADDASAALECAGVAVYDSETEAYYLVEDESGEKHKVEDVD